MKCAKCHNVETDSTSGWCWLCLNNAELVKKEEYKMICSEQDCYNQVEHDELEKSEIKKGNMYPPIFKCFNCRTDEEHKRIKAWRKRHRK